MTKPASHKYRNYIRFLADRLWLRDLTFYTPTEHARPGATASVMVNDFQKSAKIYFAHDFDEYSPESKRAAIIHELLHVHWQEQHRLVRAAKERVNKNYLDILVEGLEFCEENTVHTFASIVAGFFPTWEEYEAGRKAHKKAKKK